MRTKKFLFTAVIWISIGLILLKFYEVVLIPIDERFEILEKIIAPLVVFLIIQSWILFSNTPIFDRSPFRAKEKDRRIVYISEIISFLVIGVIAFYVGPSYFQTFLLIILTLGLWYGLMYVFGSDDLKMRIKWELRHPIRRRESEE